MTTTPRSSFRRRAMSAVCVIVTFGATACGASGSTTGSVAATRTGPGTRPSTPATLVILEPAPNDVSGPDVHLVVKLTGATVVQAAGGPIHPDEGHVHVSLDGQLVSMAYGVTQELRNTAPGPHSIQAEFVAVDHIRFANRVVAKVLFTVKP